MDLIEEIELYNHLWLDDVYMSDWESCCWTHITEGWLCAECWEHC